MNVLLVDVDSKIPNLALMKLSAYHKANGDSVTLKTLGENIANEKNRESMFDMKSYDKIYGSIIFKKNKDVLYQYKITYPNTEIVIGGSGYDLNSWLPKEIEFTKPDYSLYKNCDSSYGYTTRGCDRQCYFCIVPKKEGKFRKWQHPSRFYDPKFEKITFLDNNILWNKEWFKEVCTWCINRGLYVWFTQGLDLRLLEKEDVEILKRIKRKNALEFAWDNINLEPMVEKKIKMLQDCGIKTHTQVQVYVYVDSDEEFENGLYRCNKLKEWDTNPFVMFNIDNYRSQRIIDLARWANKKMIFWSTDFDSYRKKVIKGYEQKSLFDEY